MKTKKQTVLRRTPQRERGQIRVNKILDAATQLFAKLGYEATTTNEIAALAEVPIGSIYQFFINKEAILRAVSQRYSDEMHNLFEIIITPKWANLSATELAHRVIDGIVDFDQSHIAFRQIFLDTRMGSLIGAEELHNYIIDRIDYGYEMRFPKLPLATRKLFAITSLTVIKSLLSLAHDYQNDMQTQIISETKVVLANYLRHIARIERSLPSITLSVQ